MAQTALPAPRAVARRRALFGLLDADGWGWAAVKAGFWFVVIVTMLGYIPDRAYYFTVGRTVELWPAAPFLKWSVVNLCPPENNLSACPVPAGATLPWEISPAELKLPAGRTDGAATIVGARKFYIGGTDGTTASADVYIAESVGTGNITPWAAGPALPAPRVDAAVVTVGNSILLMGGTDASGAPTDTTWRLQISTDGTIGTWEEVADLKLPAPVTGASAVALTDGVLLIGGAGPDGAPVADVWKAAIDTQGKFATWKQQNPLVVATADGVGAHVGDWVYLVGGRTADGPSGGMQALQVAEATTAAHGGTAAASPSPGTEAVLPRWAVSNALNLPAPRTNAAGYTINGALYIIGGSDGSALSNEVWWTVPKADGTHDGWKHMTETDLGSGVQGAVALASGANAFVIGGTTDAGVTQDIARANLAPQDPFFQLGVLGATVPGLKIDGEIGQQLGYLNAAGVGTVNFIVLILIGLAFNHRAKTAALLGRFRRGRRAG